MDFAVFYCILIQFNGVLMNFAVFYCILLYFRSLRIPRTFEGRVVKVCKFAYLFGFLESAKNERLRDSQNWHHGQSFLLTFRVSKLVP